MVKRRGGKNSNPETDAFFSVHNNDQNDQLLLAHMTNKIGPSFKLFQKSVCFQSRRNKAQWKGVQPVGCKNGKSIYETCACVKTFHRISRGLADPEIQIPWIHAALVEGVVGAIPGLIHIRPIADRSICDFHSCFMIVDPGSRELWVFNPWQEGQLRSGIVNSVDDIRPRLVRNLVRKYRGYNVFHKSGKQVGTTDCRLQVLRFINTLGRLGTEFRYGIDWRLLFW